MLYRKSKTSGAVFNDIVCHRCIDNFTKVSADVYIDYRLWPEYDDKQKNMIDAIKCVSDKQSANSG
jgi:hypothetical protein